VDSSPDTAPSLFRPAKGAYIPFSDGPRACLGRRFAQVEILAALAVIFQKYSVELYVEDPNIDCDIADLHESLQRELWVRSRNEAERKLHDDMSTIITLQLRKNAIKVRICERGNEYFNWIEDY